jgi:glycosyltransferase involved in cell wall biosynthesis
MNWFKPKVRPKVAINLRPRRGSWGGANQWTSQLTAYLKFSGYEVLHDLHRPVDCLVMTHTGLSDGVSFTAADVKKFRESFPQVPCLHRINDNDIRKGTGEMDDVLAAAGTVATHTVFVSDWLKDYHAAKWFDSDRPHSVIEPGADSSVFHPFGNLPPEPGAPMRIVTHHWSDNWSKGFDIYQEIDEEIASGNLKGFELCIVGRWPKEIQWKTARTYPPASGPKLADILRQCHLYVSASRFEPGAMHPVEGLQCGLPLIYHKDTGGTVTQGLRYGIAIEGSVREAVMEARDKYISLRKALLASPPSGDWMCLQYRRLIQKLIVESGQ